LFKNGELRMNKMFLTFALLFFLPTILLAESAMVENEYYIENLKVQRTIYELSGPNATIVNLTIENTGAELANLQLKETISKNLNVQIPLLDKVDLNQPFVALTKDGSIELQWKISKISKGETISLPYKISKTFSKSALESSYAMPSIIQEIQDKKPPAAQELPTVDVQVQNQTSQTQQVEGEGFDPLYLIIGIVGIIVAIVILTAKQSRIEK